MLYIFYEKFGLVSGLTDCLVLVMTDCLCSVLTRWHRGADCLVRYHYLTKYFWCSSTAVMIPCQLYWVNITNLFKNLYWHLHLKISGVFAWRCKHRVQKKVLHIPKKHPWILHENMVILACFTVQYLTLYIRLFFITLTTCYNYNSFFLWSIRGSFWEYEKGSFSELCVLLMHAKTQKIV